MTIGDMIRNRRLELNMTQEDLAKACETTKATVSRWESGNISKIRCKNIALLCNKLQLEERIFFERKEVLLPDEYEIIVAYRKADELDRAMVRRALHIGEKNDMSVSEISTTS